MSGFKTKEELKQFLDNLGTEYRFGCYSEKKPEVCHLLGEYLDIIKHDYPKAARIYKTNCEDNDHPRSCHSYGTYVLVGKGQVQQSFATAYEYFMKACKLNVAASCFNAGLMTLKGDPILTREKDYLKGLDLLDKACSLNHKNACFYLSLLYINGSQEKNIEKDMKQAFKYSEKACELGNINACANLSIMYKKGDGVDKNEQMSEKYRNRVEDLRAELDPVELETVFSD